MSEKKYKPEIRAGWHDGEEYWIVRCAGSENRSHVHADYDEALEHFEREVEKYLEPKKPRLLAWRNAHTGVVFMEPETQTPADEWTRAPWLDEPEDG